MQWTYCPECGCEKITEINFLGEGSRSCNDCGQEWWVDIDYTSAVILNLQRFKLDRTKKDAEISALKKEIEALKTQNAAYKLGYSAMEKIKNNLQLKQFNVSNAEASLESEKEMNAILTKELEEKDKRIAELVEELKPLYGIHNDGIYTEHFKEWRSRFFEPDINIKHFKSLHNGNPYSLKELEVKYEKAMLQSPINK